jgi:hypothetical protein
VTVVIPVEVLDEWSASGAQALSVRRMRCRGDIWRASKRSIRGVRAARVIFPDQVGT